jgi:hypothetical protein
MNTKKALIVGLLATVGGGLLQADSLTFTFTSTGAVSFAGGIGTTFSASSLKVGTVYSDEASSICAACTLAFSTTVTGFSDQTGGSGSLFGYGTGASSSGTAFNVAGGTLPNPSAPPPNFTGTLANGSIVANPITTGESGGYQIGNNPSFLTFVIPVTAVASANLTNIFAAFGLTQAAGDGGTLQFTVTATGGNRPTLGNNGAFSGTLSSATLTLDAVPKIPEPASVLLIGLGLICVAFVGRKRMLANRI